MAVEFEVKFRATRGQLDAIRDKEPGQERRYAMETTYYDTPEGALSAKRYTLRRRRENDRSICTLKTPEKDGGRQEYELDCDSIREAIPELCKLAGQPELAAGLVDGVVPVCGAAFHRIAKTVDLEGGSVELALDVGVLTGGLRERPLCEVEVELKEGSRELALGYARRLAAEYGLVQEKKSKFRRALELTEGEK